MRCIVFFRLIRLRWPRADIERSVGAARSRQAANASAHRRCTTVPLPMRLQTSGADPFQFSRCGAAPPDQKSAKCSKRATIVTYQQASSNQDNRHARQEHGSKQVASTTAHDTNTATSKIPSTAYRNKQDSTIFVLQVSSSTPCWRCLDILLHRPNRWHSHLWPLAFIAASAASLFAPAHRQGAHHPGP
jgi:hypothetical protein